MWANVYFDLPDKKFALGVTELTAQYDGTEAKGAFNIKVPNATGRFDTLCARVEVGSRSSSEMSASWRLPRFLARRWGASFDVHRKIDNRVIESSYKLLSRGFQVALQPLVHHSVGFNMDWRDVIPTPQTPEQRPPLLVGPSRSVCLAGTASVKSSVSHTYDVSTLDDVCVPTRGAAFKSRVEIAGPGGDVEHVRADLRARALFPLAPFASLHASTRIGVLHSWRGDATHGSHLPDRFMVGGTNSVRGFEEGGIGPRDRGDALGADVLCEAKAALEFDLPNDMLKQAGLRVHAFVNGANAVSAAEFARDPRRFFAPAQWSAAAGVGIAMPGPLGTRIELNWTQPLRARSSDRPAPGIQFGIGLAEDAL